MAQITKEEFVSILEAASIGEQQQIRLHQEFERRNPEAHDSFLRWLGIPAETASQIRARAKTSA